ncbi:prolyl oligopeptidase family serine peptidase [Isoptericola cucumis]|uniref:Prolyl oligopeptidase n=1 Tax=Isoptericola cucumis TaxID=1776856 RepID=A0ABQ2BA05_9MICO|nr:prolyl oligopeptidase family serine peptidase [Isoptericola cucumis]GGI09053.1 prolyl oligopeptidase [Isoptericola cucumis]
MTAEQLASAAAPATTPGRPPATPLDPDHDPYPWLEEVEGAEALDWVRERNAHAHATVGAAAGFAATEAAVREVLDSDARIPEVSRIGEHLYNFWRDAEHERGLWRRTTLAEYRTDAPAWETVLDLDALAAAEGQSWVWHGATLLRPTPEQLAAGEPWRRALVDLSPGGSDADVTREFDLVAKRFVPAAEGGFERDTARADGRTGAKGGLAWADEDTVYVFTDFGAGTTTPSGYPRTVRLWRRGTPLADAVVVYEGADDDMYISARRSRTPGFERDLVSRSIAFYRSETFLVEGVGTPGQRLVKIEVPESAEVGFHREWLLVELRDDWTPDGSTARDGDQERTYAAGSLLAAPADDFLAGRRDLTVLFAPTASTSLVGAAWTRHHLVLNILDDVKNRLHVLTPPVDATAGTAWQRADLPVGDDLVTVGARAVDPLDSDDVWLTTTGYLTPSTLALATVGGPDGEADREDASVAPEVLKTAPAFFDATGMVVDQHFATSDDGTRVPYFVVGREELVRPADPTTPGTAPTLLYGYGGFEIPLLPGYSGTVGRAWLADGGVHVVANIRGGGEYGPAWHQAALRSRRHRAYEDFAAVARDLVARGITSPPHLGAQGGSNGGLLAGNMLTQYPELFGAVVIQVPLLDMKRYSHLLAGASWTAEYGDPDSDDWEFVRTFSPYHLLDAGRDYPPVLLTTSTKDDRVHPGHARKMAALLLATGKDVTSYENVEGGHGGAANNAQAAHMAALAWTFLRERLA